MSILLDFKTKKNYKTRKGCPVYLTITAAGETRRINTGVYVESEDMLVDGRIVAGDKAGMQNTRLDYLMNICSTKTSRLDERQFKCMQIKEYLDEYLKCNSVNRNINTLDDLFRWKINALNKSGKNSSAQIIKKTQDKVMNILGDICVHDLKAKHIKQLVDTMYRQGKSDGSVSLVLKNMKSIFNQARAEGIVIYKENPFEYISIPKAKTIFYDLTEEEFVRLRDYPIADYNLRFVRDMFVLSFYLGGMYMLDLKKVDFKKDFISYRSSRHESIKKYNHEICLAIPVQARDIIQRYSVNGVFQWPKKTENINLYDFFKNRLKRLKEELDIISPLTVNSPGKTFAQFAIMNGVEKDVVKYCLGQNVDFQTPIYNYIKVVKSQADKAVKTVIHFVEGLRSVNKMVI